MTRQRSLRVTQRDEGLLPRIQVLKAEHPFWGYRRTWAYLHFVEKLPVNKKRILRVMREHSLLVAPHLRLKAERTPSWYTKKIVGYYAGMLCTARQWLAALDMALNRQFPDGVRGQEVSLMSDNGCQPTAMAFMGACSTLGIHQAFTSYNTRRAMLTPSG